MGRSFNQNPWRYQRRLERLGRLQQRFGSASGKFDRLRARLRRSPDGWVLGVFRGIAESLGFSVCWTRVLGSIALLMISDSIRGHGSLLLMGFTYVLLAVLMRKPDPEPRLAGLDADRDLISDHEDSSPEPRQFGRPTFETRAARRTAAVPFQQVAHAPRVDFVALDRQIDALNRRIQQMEAVVTDRQYDWDRRMES